MSSTIPAPSAKTPTSAYTGRLGHCNSLKQQKSPQKASRLCGCMMQEKEVVEKIRTSYRFVDLVFGTHNIFRLAELLYRRLTEGKPVYEIWQGPTDRRGSAGGTEIPV